MENGQREPPGAQTNPVLYLRPRVATELIRPRQKIKQPDGPWIAHPELINEEWCGFATNDPKLPPDTTMAAYRDLWRDRKDERSLKGVKREDIHIESIIDLHRSIDMQKMRGLTDHYVAHRIECFYVGALHYLVPGVQLPPLMTERFGGDWGLNARGIYYRHHYSPGWVTAGHDLWLPSLDQIDWKHSSEDSRRLRAEKFVKHVLDNERWNKSEYAWEADAWTDVFGHMRNDPALAVDKHEYNAIREKRHPVSCLMAGEPKFIKRIPDATIGLATFQPEDYPSALAEYDLDRERLESILLHRHCNLKSDPRWGDANLVFPFAVYEAKGWAGDSREARRQACSAGATYLDLLDNLTRHPGKLGQKDGAYQTSNSRNTQVFALTSFGAHWHVLVGYKRPRLKREYAGYQGMSASVYVFQRIWSGRVTTKRRAWELLQIIDQIHIWGATDFRDFVIRHLKPWHEFGKKCYVNDVDYMHCDPDAGSLTVDGQPMCGIPGECQELPGWTEHVTEDARGDMKWKLARHMANAYSKYNTKTRSKCDKFERSVSCNIGECGPVGGPGYPLAGLEDVELHLREIHGEEPDQVDVISERKGFRLKRRRSGDDAAGPEENVGKAKKKRK